jgi:5'-nucleotidase
MKGKTLPYKIFIKDDIKIGVFGLGIELRGLVDKNLSGDTQYHDPVVAAAQQSLYLKEEEKCDLIICLSHLGFKYKDEKISDIALAKQSKNIDLIIGAHTHTFLDEPINIINRDGKKVLVAQAGWAGLRLGRIDFYFEKNTKKKMHEASTLKIFNYASAI